MVRIHVGEPNHLKSITYKVVEGFVYEYSYTEALFLR